MALNIKQLAFEFFKNNQTAILITAGSVAALSITYGAYAGSKWVVRRGWRKDKAEADAHVKEMKDINTAKIAALKIQNKLKNDDVFRSFETYDFLARPHVKKWSWAGIKERWIAKDEERVMLIRMELRNGNHRTFIVKEDEKGFYYKGGKYLFDDELKYYDIDTKTWCFDFHEDFSLPIKRKLPIADIKKTLAASRTSEVEFATNPQTLEQFITARIAEGIMKGQELDAWMTQIRVLTFIILVVVVIHLLVFVKKTGMLDAIKLPF